jgi:hypothetical protein
VGHFGEFWRNFVVFLSTLRVRYLIEASCTQKTTENEKELATLYKIKTLIKSQTRVVYGLQRF